MEIKLSRSLAELENIVSMTQSFFEKHGLNSKRRHATDLCIEELFVNMITYNTETNKKIKLEILPHDRGIEVSLTDYEVARFDPRQMETVDTNAPLDQRTPGGLGLYLVLKMVDSINYEYRDRTSKVTFLIGEK